MPVCPSIRGLLFCGSQPARSPDLNSFAERWVKSVKEECLSKLILFGEKSLRHALREHIVYHHHERNHQGKENLLLFPASDPLPQSERKVRSRERVGYHGAWLRCAGTNR